MCSQPRLLTVAEAAERMNVNERFIRRLCLREADRLLQTRDACPRPRGRGRSVHRQQQGGGGMICSGPDWDDAVAEGRRLVAQEEDAKWRLGDLALELVPLRDRPGRPENRYAGTNILTEFAKAIDIDVGTLRQYRTVAAAWPPQTRVGGRSWSWHQDNMRSSLTPMVMNGGVQISSRTTLSTLYNMARRLQSIAELYELWRASEADAELEDTLKRIVASAEAVRKQLRAVRPETKE